MESAVNAVSAALTTEDLTKYVAEVAVDKKDYDTVAKRVPGRQQARLSTGRAAHRRAGS